MKNIFLFFLFSLLSLVLGQAQTLKGVVIDSKTNEPINDAIVYLAGTTYSTTTDHKGFFELFTSEQINSNLVVRHLAYESVMVENPFDSLPAIFPLIEKNILLDEVDVNNKCRFNRKQLMRAFKSQFLGDSQAGKACVIQNEDDISFYYDEEQKRLKAFCNTPISVHNKYLGYIVNVELNQFEATYKNSSLHDDQIKSVHFFGPMAFVDIENNRPVIARRRKEAFKTSSKRFFRLLVNNQLSKNDFVINSTLSSGEMFIIEDDPVHTYSKKLTIHPNFKQNFGDDPAMITVSYYKPIQGRLVKVSSGIKFMKDTLTIDSYGNLQDVRDVWLSGAMGEKRIGDMLPLDYRD